MRKLTKEEITKLVSFENVRKIAVENFLMSLDLESGFIAAQMNLEMDTKLYKWNYETHSAIYKGICLAFK